MIFIINFFLLKKTHFKQLNSIFLMFLCYLSQFFPLNLICTKSRPKNLNFKNSRRNLENLKNNSNNLWQP